MTQALSLNFFRQANAENKEYKCFEEPELVIWLSKFLYGTRTSDGISIYAVDSWKKFQVLLPLPGNA